MIRYVIEKTICNDYAHGIITLTDKNGELRTFSSEDSALEYLISLEIPVVEIAKLYKIKPYIA